MDSIRDIRNLLGITQSELAAKLGLHQTTISRFETGDLPIDERTALALDALVMRATPPDKPEAARGTGTAGCDSCQRTTSTDIAACTGVDCPMRERQDLAA